jgi:hypothetical protein
MGFTFLRYEAKELLLNKDWISPSKWLRPCDAIKSHPMHQPHQHWSTLSWVLNNAKIKEAKAQEPCHMSAKSVLMSSRPWVASLGMGGGLCYIPLCIGPWVMLPSLFFAVISTLAVAVGISHPSNWPYMFGSSVTARLGLKAAAKARLWGAQAFKNPRLSCEDGFRPA